jgi:hypothetical protein
MHGGRIVGWDGDERSLLVGVHLLDPHHRPGPLSPGDHDRASQHRGRLQGVTQQ